MTWGVFHHFIFLYVTSIFSDFWSNISSIFVFVQDECSFVSLRDVERVLSVMAWFYHHKDVLYSLMDQRAEELFRAEYHAEEEFQNRVRGGLMIKKCDTCN